MAPLYCPPGGSRCSFLHLAVDVVKQDFYGSPNGRAELDGNIGNPVLGPEAIYAAIAAISNLADERATKDALRELVARGLLLFDRADAASPPWFKINQFSLPFVFN